MKHLFVLIFGAFVENFGYRQLMSVWRLEGIIKWILKTESSWGTMTRNTSWQTQPIKTQTLPPIPAKQDVQGSKTSEKQPA